MVFSLNHEEYKNHLEKYEKHIFTKFRALEYDISKLYELNANSRKLFKNNKYFGQILKSSSLYATSFIKLNDIYECAYSYYDDKGMNIYKNYKEKLKHSICSLSQKDKEGYNEHLMWAHYANAHCGVKIDFKIDIDKLLTLKEDKDLSCMICEVTYNDNRTLCKNNEDFNSQIKKIMTTKKTCWRYEGEYRVLFSDMTDSFPIKIKKITLGKKFLIGTISNVEEYKYRDNIKTIAKDMIKKWKSGKHSYQEPEIYSYTSKYSDDIEKVI